MDIIPEQLRRAGKKHCADAGHYSVKGTHPLIHHLYI